MKSIGVWCVSVVLCAAGPAQAATTMEELEARLERQETVIQDLRQQVQGFKQQDRVREAEQAGRDMSRGLLPEQSETLAKRRAIPGSGGIYDKPFLRRIGNVHVGGYADIEYKDAQNSNARFDQHRLIPFFYADVSDQVKFASEIEFEHGGNSETGGEVNVEFATIDYQLAEPLNFRGGIILSPLGKLNAVHDSPLQDLTDRPLVDTFVIPTTLSEPGAGVYGTVYPTELSKLDYEAYITNGFRGMTGETAGTVLIDRTSGLREARGRSNSDNNDEPAFVGRLGFSPFLGMEVGASTHLGTYDQRGKNLLAIWALDGSYQYGPFELLGEAAFADIQRDALAESIGVPDALYGYYLQGNYHFMPEFLRQRFPRVFRPESTFTFVNRWDWTNLDGQIGSRYTVGLNFRPMEDAVFKADFQFNQEDGSRNSIDNNALVLSAATYF